jgi:uroporphyrinogen-III decarboxylase
VGWKRVEYTTSYGRGYYTEIAGHPLADAAALSSYRPPDPLRVELYQEAGRVVRKFKDEYWIVGVTVTTIFECAWALRGYEQLLTDFVLNPELADCILEIPYRYHLAAARKLVEMGVDMIWVGDDVGSQSRLLISPATWRRFLKPRLANFIAELKALNPQVKVAYHSDGFIYPIIPELVEIGVDVLNPVQPASLDPARLKQEFGERLCFWGTIDEQHTLPFGSPEDVREEVLARLRTTGAGGGLILSPTHHVQLDTPLENFWAMVNTVRETRYSDL